MSEDFDIPMTNELSKEVNSMCNFSQGFIERGREEGIEIGVEKNKTASLKTVMNKLKLSFAEACDLLDIPEAEREEYYARINDKTNPADKNG